MDRLKGHRLKAGVRNSKHFSLNPFSLNTFYIYTSTLVLPHIYLDVMSWIFQGIVFTY